MFTFFKIIFFLIYGFVTFMFFKLLILLETEDSFPKYKILDIFKPHSVFFTFF
jgi:hypothetical protein